MLKSQRTGVEHIMSPKLQRFLSQWKFDRDMTIDLLRSLSNEDLNLRPGHNVGEFWKQFRHLGRVQENYMDALETGTVQFESTGAYSGAPDGTALLEYLNGLDQRLGEQLSMLDETRLIDWFGEEQITAFDHLLRMMGHETLHHGQLIVYCKLLNKPFPASWKVWGL